MMFGIRVRLVVLFLMISAGGTVAVVPNVAAEVTQAKIPVFGYIERARLEPSEIILSAKLDTGADHSSLHASHVTALEQDGRKLVRFSFKDRRGHEQEVTLPIFRIARIKKIGEKPQERYVVKLAICIGDQRMEAEVNLVNRSRLKYPLLIGRGFLAGNALVDASKTYLTEPRCDVLAQTGSSGAPSIVAHELPPSKNTPSREAKGSE